MFPHLFAGDSRFLGAVPFGVMHQRAALVENVQVKDGHLAEVN